MQDVFEPTANFDGEVFEPMNFDGDYSNFYKFDVSKIDPKLVQQGLQVGGQIIGGASQMRASKEAGKTDTQRQIDTICGSRQKFLSKKKRDNYNNCKNQVIAKIDKQAQSSIDLTNKQLDLSKVSLQSANTNKEAEIKAKNRRNLILGASIGGGILVLGTILFFVLRKK
jgi:hypothetical protein